MSARKQSALRLVVDNTLPSTELARREEIAAPLIAIAQQAYAGGLSAVYCIYVEHNGDGYLKMLGQVTEMAGEALHGVQAIGEILCERLGRQPGTGWVSSL
jgi:hypothetical protein